MKNYYESDESLVIPKKYLKWSSKKVDRVIRRREAIARIKNRLTPTRKTPDFGYKVNL